VKNIRQLEEQYKKLGEEIEALKNNDGFPVKWEDVTGTEGFYVDERSNIVESFVFKNCAATKNMFCAREQAEASIALAQLSRLMYVYNDGWCPNWTDDSIKYVIFYRNESVASGESYTVRYFLSFKTQRIRDLFLNNFRNLIEKAKPLM